MKKLILGISLVGVFLCIVLFISFKDHSQTVGQKEFGTLISKARNFQIDETYLYFQIGDKNYKILKSSTLLDKIDTPITQKSHWLIYTLLAFLLIVACVVLFLLRHKIFCPRTHTANPSPHLAKKETKTFVKSFGFAP